MEGTLFKWTNYYNGWQLRYFILSEAGILSYYKAAELIHEGCKGSCLVLACEVKVHPYDLLRFDLIIPGEQFFCLKAKSPPERQRWLVALGTCKSRGTASVAAAVTVCHNKSNNGLDDNASPVLISQLTTPDHEMKVKVQELCLYETVLTQRIHTIKSIANDTAVPDVQKLDECASVLSVTCDAFIHTLDEFVKLATGESSQSLLLLSSPSPVTSHGSKASSQPSLSDAAMSVASDAVANDSYKTFFSQLSKTFAQLSSVKFKDICVEPFLATCELYLNLIDKFNSKTFIPLRADASGNISKLRRKVSNDPVKFQTLYSIVNDEIAARIAREKNSATDALLWLKRSIQFLGCFLSEFGQGDQTVADALNKAYEQTLKRFHGWIARGVFSIALRSSPYQEELIASLAVDPGDAQDIAFKRQVLNEMREHGTHINRVMSKITEFYAQNELDSDEIIG